MRKYTLASPTAKSAVDLRAFADVIRAAVHQYMPLAIVRVERDCYYVEPTPPKGMAIRIGRQICKSALSRYCVQIPKLFSSIEVKSNKEEENENESDQQRSGGHF